MTIMSLNSYTFIKDNFPNLINLKVDEVGVGLGEIIVVVTLNIFFYVEKDWMFLFHVKNDDIDCLSP